MEYAVPYFLAMAMMIYFFVMGRQFTLKSKSNRFLTLPSWLSPMYKMGLKDKNMNTIPLGTFVYYSFLWLFIFLSTIQFIIIMITLRNETISGEVAILFVFIMEGILVIGTVFVLIELFSAWRKEINRNRKNSE